MTLVDDFQPLTYVTKNTILNVAGVLDPPLKSILTIMHKVTHNHTLIYPYVPFRVTWGHIFCSSSFVCSYVLLFHTIPCHKFKENLNHNHIVELYGS